jgi:hypothetical protein
MVILTILKSGGGLENRYIKSTAIKTAYLVIIDSAVSLV